jgi:quercetin dioxygenase-like cupin family protein
VKPIAGTESCEVAHLGFVQAGRMHVRMDDGQEEEVGPGDVLMIPPGHDAWVVGNETCVVLDFAGMEHYAERAAQAGRQPGAPPAQPAAY